MNRADLNLVVVRGDGEVVRWLAVPRWLPTAIVVLVALVAVANGAILISYMSLSREHATLVATQEYLDRNARAASPVRQRLVEVRDEMRSWDALHAAVWKPLGGQQRAAAIGIGGPALAAAKGGKRLDDIDVLLAYVRDESRRLRELSHLTRETGGFLASLPSRLPLRSAINSTFGPRVSPWTGRPEFHAGLDLAAAAGTPLKATAGGIVRFAGTADGYGQSILLDHGAGIESRYGHLQMISVVRGQRVERGQPIGLTGNSGRSTGPHLHYEVLVNGRPIDPRQLTRE